MAYICENQSLSIVTSQGQPLASVSLSTLPGLGRLKALSIAPSKEVSKGDYAVLVSSTGCLAVLESKQLILEEHEEAGGEEEGLIRALVAFDQLKSEPRLTAVVVWNAATAAKTNKKRKNQKISSEDDANAGDGRHRNETQSKTEIEKPSKKSPNMLQKLPTKSANEDNAHKKQERRKKKTNNKST